MANYQLGPVIGKIGGGSEIEEIPVSTPGGGNSTSHILTVDAGDGAWIFVEGTLAWRNPSSTANPGLIVGNRDYGSTGPRAGGGGHFTGEVVISLRTNHYSDSPFSGTVYVIR